MSHNVKRDALERIIRELAREVISERKLRPDQKLEIDVYESTDFILGEKVELRAHYYRTVGDGYGRDGIKDYRAWSVEFNVARMYRNWRVGFDGMRQDIIRELFAQARYVVAMVLPPPKPKWYRILHRRHVLAPGPSFRSRIGCFRRSR